VRAVEKYNTSVALIILEGIHIDSTITCGRDCNACGYFWSNRGLNATFLLVTSPVPHNEKPRKTASGGR
jgi:hypothetical protein